QGGMTCPTSGPEPVQDGGAMFGNCCPRDVLQATSRDAPTGACTGSQQCFVAVHQVCDAPQGPTGSAPLDEYVCACDGAMWQCTLMVAGLGVCPRPEAGAEGD